MIFSKFLNILNNFRCPLSCGDCCHDDDECRGLPLNDALCSSFAHIRKKCPSTCGTCDIEKNMGKYVILSMKFHPFILKNVFPESINEFVKNNILR